MAVELESASRDEFANEPDFVMIGEAGLPAQVQHAGERLDQACFRAGSAGRALRTVDTYIFLPLLRTTERAGAPEETLELKRTIGNWRLWETTRVCNAYRAADKIDHLQNGFPHRIDMIA